MLYLDSSSIKRGSNTIVQEFQNCYYYIFQIITKNINFYLISNCKSLSLYFLFKNPQIDNIPSEFIEFYPKSRCNFYNGQFNKPFPID